MAVSKRLRYEVLRRDNHACRYCGAAAPDVKLNVDHVIPQALGGPDHPTNLVTACTDCNAGKTSSMPGAATVAEVDQDAVRQAREAIEQHRRELMQTILAGWHELATIADTWCEAWRDASPDGIEPQETPQLFKDTLAICMKAEVSHEAMRQAAHHAGSNLDGNLLSYLPADLGIQNI